MILMITSLVKTTEVIVQDKDRGWSYSGLVCMTYNRVTGVRIPFAPPLSPARDTI